MNVVFLDYDGVVNTPMWDGSGTQCRFNFPEDGKVNNFQAVQWVSEFCEKIGYDIVVSSTWRWEKNYIDCLRKGGLRKSVKVVGKTPTLPGRTRGEEIKAYLIEHPEVIRFIIFDDENDLDIYDEEGRFVDSLEDRLILCNPNVGFGLTEFYEAEQLDRTLRRKEMLV